MTLGSGGSTFVSTTFGFCVHLEASTETQIKEICDNLMNFIDTNELDFGGGYISKSTHYICGFICYPNKSCTEETRTAVLEWCSTQPLTKTIVEDLIPDDDPDYDYDCKDESHFI